MGISSIVLFLVIGPGLVFFLVSGKTNEVKSLSGWLFAFPVGLMIDFFTCIYFLFTKQSQVIANIIEASNVHNYTSFGFFVYVFAISFGVAWRAVRLSEKLAKFWLFAERKFRGEGKLFVAKNLLEHLLCICYAVKITPEIEVILFSDSELKGRCIKYQWTEPKSILLLKDSDEISFIWIKISELKTICLLNWTDLKIAKHKDPGMFLRLIDDNLPEMLDGKRDGCGNMWKM